MTDLLPWQNTQWAQMQQARDKQRLPHAVLLTGLAGIGKLIFAKYLAHSLICTQPDAQGVPCKQCRSCQLIAVGNHPDLNLVFPEAAGKQIKVDAVRALISRSVLSVNEGQHRVFIFDPADAMGHAASNALLKTLEEPVAGTLLILVSAQPALLPATIKSRCQILRFSNPALVAAKDWLQQCGVAAQEQDGLLQMADGAPLAALQIREQGLLPVYNEVMQEFLALDATGNPPQIAEKWLKQLDGQHLIDYLILWLQDILRWQQGATRLRVIPETYSNSLKNRLKQLDLRTYYPILDLLYESKRKLVNNLNMQLVIERFLIHWIHLNKR